MDGDPGDWSGPSRFDEYADVVPDTNSTVDLVGYEFGGAGRIFNVSDTLFTFLFQFVAPPFQGPEETTVEIFFDMSESDTYGEAQGPWRDFRPDYVIGATGSKGPSPRSSTGAGRAARGTRRKGPTFPRWTSPSRPDTWKEPGTGSGIPDTDRHHLEVESYNQLKAVRVSKGEFRDYVPNDDYALGGQILPSAVESDTWGGIKSR